VGGKKKNPLSKGGEKKTRFVIPRTKEGGEKRTFRKKGGDKKLGRTAKNFEKKFREDRKGNC